MSFSFIHKRKIQIALRFIVDFLKHNPIHCTSYLAKTQIHWLELMFWILALFIFLIIGLICGMDLVADYVSRNTALTTNVVNAATRTFYPSLTLCPHDILDEKKLKVFKREYAKKLLKMQYFPNPYKFLKEIWKLEEFLQQLSKTTARTAYSYASVSTIPQEDYMQLIFKYWQDLEPYPKMYSDRFTQNPFTFYSSFPLRTNINHNITGKITVYAHNPFEVPTIWTRPALIINNHNKPYILKAAIQQITFDETAFKKKFNEFTFFQNINESQLSAPFSSSRNLCVMECRAHYIRKLCNCLPHFYAHAYWRDSNVCNIQGLNCFYQYIKIIRTINTNTISPTFRCDHCQPNHIEQIVVVKAERRAIQEAKELQAQAQSAAATKETRSAKRATSSSPVKTVRFNDGNVKLFSHLEKPNTNVIYLLIIHTFNPSIARLGEQYAKRTIVGSNARCLAFLGPLKWSSEDYETQLKKEF
ncbi:Translation initiation factor eIF-2B subunit delta [Lucilia cuprina]|nr:Translation initiation factor eIF-2B subunit delta [Lucilia cuprina]